MIISVAWLFSLFFFNFNTIHISYIKIKVYKVEQKKSCDRKRPATLVDQIGIYIQHFLISNITYQL